MNKYANDYETVVIEDENGNEKKMAVYRGDYFEVALDQGGLTRFKRNCFLLLAAMVVLHISSGFVGNRGMYQFYVALPYVLAFFPLVYLAEGVLRLPKEKRKYRRDEIGLSFEKLKTNSTALMIFLGIIVLGETAFLLFGVTFEPVSLEYLFLALEITAFVALFFLFRLQRHIEIQTSEEQLPM